MLAHRYLDFKAVQILSNEYFYGFGAIGPLAPEVRTRFALDPGPQHVYRNLGTLQCNVAGAAADGIGCRPEVFWKDNEWFFHTDPKNHGKKHHNPIANAWLTPGAALTQHLDQISNIVLRVGNNYDPLTGQWIHMSGAFVYEIHTNKADAVQETPTSQMFFKTNIWCRPACNEEWDVRSPHVYQNFLEYLDMPTLPIHVISASLYLPNPRMPHSLPNPVEDFF